MVNIKGTNKQTGENKIHRRFDKSLPSLLWKSGGEKKIQRYMFLLIILIISPTPHVRLVFNLLQLRRS